MNDKIFFSNNINGLISKKMSSKRSHGIALDEGLESGHAFLVRSSAGNEIIAVNCWNTGAKGKCDVGVNICAREILLDFKCHSLVVVEDLLSTKLHFLALQLEQILDQHKCMGCGGIDLTD